MNDFTKEELIAISQSICRDWSEHPIYITLLEKLQSMIDNFDHHKENYVKGISIIEHVINELLPVDCEEAAQLTEALVCIDGADDE